MPQAQLQKAGGWGNAIGYGLGQGLDGFFKAYQWMQGMKADAAKTKAEQDRAGRLDRIAQQEQDLRKMIATVSNEGKARDESLVNYNAINGRYSLIDAPESMLQFTSREQPAGEQDFGFGSLPTFMEQQTREKLKPYPIPGQPSIGVPGFELPLDTREESSKKAFDATWMKSFAEDQGKTHIYTPGSSGTRPTARPGVSETFQGPPREQPIPPMGSEGAYIIGKYGKNPTPDQMLQGAKEHATATWKPSLVNMLGGGPGTNGALTDEGVDYAATQYRVTGVMPALGMGNAQARAAIINRTAQQAKALRQTPVMAIQKQAAYKADSGALGKMTTMSAAAESFETKALAQTDIISELSPKVGRTASPMLNSWLLAGKKEIAGDSDTAMLFNAITTFSTEYAKIMEGSTGAVAASSDSARKAAEDLVKATMNPTTLASVVGLMKREMRLTIDGYGATIDHITTRMGGAPPQAAPPPATASASPAGGDGTVKMKAPNGQISDVPAGLVEHYKSLGATVIR
ncbi:MAG: hypothetical protein NT151_09520 [Acidobacteria bacterium]|nr:hypothetical protein [Acidobacteriota bacterium]